MRIYRWKPKLTGRFLINPYGVSVFLWAPGKAACLDLPPPSSPPWYSLILRKLSCWNPIGFMPEPHLPPWVGYLRGFNWTQYGTQCCLEDSVPILHFFVDPWHPEHARQQGLLESTVICWPNLYPLRECLETSWMNSLVYTKAPYHSYTFNNFFNFEKMLGLLPILNY